MKLTKRGLIWNILFITFFFALIPDLHLAIAQSSKQPLPQHVLIVHSAYQGYPWTDSLNVGIHDVFDSSPVPVDLMFEYIDTKRNRDPYYFEQLRELWKIKYHNRPIDLIIVCDNEAYDFVLQERNNLFRDIPVVFTGYNGYTPDMLNGKQPITGVIEETDIAATIDVALLLHPQTKKIVFVAPGAPPFRMVWLEGLEERYSKKAQLLTITAENIEQIDKEIDSHGKDIVVIPLNSFLESNGAYFPFDQFVSHLSIEKPFPVYALWDIAIGQGVVGGKMVTGTSQGRRASELALQILQGTPISDVPVVTSSPNQYMFDWEAMQRFKISESDLPEKSILINRPISFYDENKTIVHVSLVTVFALLLFIFSLIVAVIHLRRTKKKLQQSEELLNATQRISKVGGWEWNVENQTMFWTNELYRIHDFHQDKFMSGSMKHIEQSVECYEPEDRIVVKEAFKNCIENGEAYDLEFLFHTKKCQGRWVRTIAEPILENGTVIKVIGNVIDITDHKQAEEELRKSHGRLRQTQEMAQIGHYVFDMSKDIWTSSSQLNDILGIDKSYNKSTASWLQIVHPDHREIMSNYFQYNILTEHQLFDFEYKVINQRTGHEKWMHGLGEIKLDKDSNPVELFGTIQDITERKTLENEIIKFKKLEATATLAGGIAHDFNNLLAVIVGYIDLTLDDLGMNHRKADDLKKALNASRKAQELTQKFITFSSGETLVKRKLSIKELITKSVDVVFSGADYPAELSLGENLWQVEVDAGQMNQVFKNVLINAKESTEDGGAIQIYAENISSLIDESIVAETLTDSQFVKIVISDQGEGIPDQIMPNIFDPYFTTKERGAQKGMGLGLTVALSIVQQHDGHMVVKSAEKNGTSVFIYLPAVA
jgi:two-component system cell cycle sensor histidine kinase/response regulator CckA